MFKKTLITTMILLGLSGTTFAEEVNLDSVQELQQAKSNFATNLSAEDKANQFLRDHKLRAGINSNGAIFTIGTASLHIDPNDKKILIKRSLLAQQAYLLAKAELIKTIRTELSSKTTLTLPDTGLTTEFDQKLADLKERLESKVAAYNKALKEVTKAENTQVNGLDMNMVLEAGVSSALEQEGINIDFSKIRAESKAKLDAARADLESLSNEISSLQKEAESLKKSMSSEQITTTTAIAKQTVVGASTIQTYDSYIDGLLQVSVILSWSPKQERIMTALFNPSQPTYDQNLHFTPGKLSAMDYENTTDWSTMLGGRRFIDNKGELNVYGIGVYPVLSNTGGAMNKAKAMAEISARRELASMIKGDVLSKETASQKMQTFQHRDPSSEEATETSEVVDSMARDLQEQIKNIQLQGVSKVFSGTAVYPYNNQKYYVAVMNLSYGASALAKKYEASQAKAAIQIERANKESAGYKAGLESQIDKEKKDNSAYKKGFANGVKDATVPKESQNKKSNTTNSTQTSQTSNHSNLNATKSKVGNTQSFGATGGKVDDNSLQF